MASVFRSVATAGLLTLASAAVCTGVSSASPAGADGTIDSNGSGNVNIHAEDQASDGFPMQTIGKARNGDHVRIDCLFNNGTNGIWYRLTDRSITGLVHGDFVRPDLNVTPCYKPAPVSPNM